MNNTTLEIFRKSIEDNKEKFVQLQNTVLVLKAQVKAIEEITQEIEQKILDENVYLVSDENRRAFEIEEKRITKPFNTYLMDTEEFENDYLEKCYAEFKKVGIADTRGKEWIPGAEQKKALKNAEDELLNFVIDALPSEIACKLIEARYHWEYREKIIDLTLKLSI